MKKQVSQKPISIFAAILFFSIIQTQQQVSGLVAFAQGDPPRICFEGNCSFGGNITEDGTDLPIQGVFVKANELNSSRVFNARSDSKGDFLYPYLELVPHSFKFTKEGYEDKTIRLDLAVNPDHINIKLKRIRLSASSADAAIPRILLTYPNIDQMRTLEVDSNRINITGHIFDQTSVSFVLVEGVPVQVNEKGDFSADILLKPGENTITVTAINSNKKWAVEEFTVLRKEQMASSLDNMVALAAMLRTRKYYALIIGNSKYQHLKPLQTPVQDAKKLADLLEKKYGFEIRLLLNATREQILLALNEYRAKLTIDTSLLIYYAGHGYYDSALEKGYWQPVDAREKDTIYWISVDDVTLAIKGLRATQILIISDSCYSGALTRGAEPISYLPQEREKFLLSMLEGKTRDLITSGSMEPVSDGGADGHSVFAGALFRGLSQMDRDIFTSDELFYKFIHESVVGNSNQTPQYSFIPNSGHDKGHFVFCRIKH
jgi:hypothetical protein